MDNEAVFAKIKEQFVKRGLFIKLVPINGEYVTSDEEYIVRLERELPDIYRELKENGALPAAITYDLFMRECQIGLETAQARYHYGPNVIIRR
jgi:hypothetical protein